MYVVMKEFTNAQGTVTFVGTTQNATNFKRFSTEEEAVASAEAHARASATHEKFVVFEAVVTSRTKPQPVITEVISLRSSVDKD